MFKIADTTINNRLFLGTAQYPSLAILQQAICASETDIITVALRRQAPDKQSGNEFWQQIKQLNKHILPNTAGCRTAKEAVTLANMAREIFNTNWIKLEVIGNDYNLQPDPIGLLDAAKELIAQDFIVFPYCTDDLVICTRLVDLGCSILMPWAAPIGSGQGLLNPFALTSLRNHFKDVTLIIDAGIGSPSQASAAMEMGYDAVLVNSAIAHAHDPVQMASAFKQAVEAGHLAYQAGIMPKSDIANPSTPLIDTPFWLQETVDE